MTALVASVLAVAVGSSVTAQDQPVVYTRVAQWQIARPSWGAYEKDLMKTTVPVMEKLLADGVIVEFGADRNTVHSPDGYTHSTWFCAKSLANLEKALDALVASESKLTPEERRKQDTDFSGTKHADLILRSVQFKNRTVKTEKGYGTVASQKILPGKVQDYLALYDKYTKPILEQPYADGADSLWNRRRSSTGDPACGSSGIVPDADALDKVGPAPPARSARERRAIGAAFAELTDGRTVVQASLIYYNAK
jgi:hypothetical protein